MSPWRRTAALSADNLEGPRAFESLLVDTSASLLAAPPGELDWAIERGLRQVRAFFEADRCALLSVSADHSSITIRLMSQADGIPAIPPDLNLKPLLPWSAQKLLVERVPIRVWRIEDLPPEAEAELPTWRQLSIRSTLTLPITTGAIVHHLILLQTVHHERDWPDVFISRLGLLGEMLIGALEREALLLEHQRTETRLASGADLAGLGFYEVDFVRGSAYTDAWFRDLCGIPPDHCDGLRPLAFWLEHLHPGDRDRVLDLRDQLHDGRLGQISVEYRFLHPVCGERWIHHLARVSARDATDRALQTFGVARDITDHKRAEEGLRDLSRRLISAHEEQRALLARELHDDVTQRLAVLAIDAGSAELAAAGTAQVHTLRAVREGLTRLSEDVHSLAYQLHPSVLEELGLGEALRTECERVARQGSVQISAAVDPLPGTVPKDEALCLFRVAQEALSNVLHHSGARAAGVSLRRQNEGLQLTIQDDGTGFDPESPAKGRHLGLANMRERVHLAHGMLSIESAPGHGTTITVWVPAGAPA